MEGMGDTNQMALGYTIADHAPYLSYGEGKGGITLIEVIIRQDKLHFVSEETTCSLSNCRSCISVQQDIR